LCKSAAMKNLTPLAYDNVNRRSFKTDTPSTAPAAILLPDIRERLGINTEIIPLSRYTREQATQMPGNYSGKLRIVARAHR
jgi:hypothetical protein